MSDDAVLRALMDGSIALIQRGQMAEAKTLTALLRRLKDTTDDEEIARHRSSDWLSGPASGIDEQVKP